METKPLTYNDAIKEIETILDKIENGEPDVDELSALVKRAGFLINFCKTKLHVTEKEIDKILSDTSNTDSNNNSE